MSSLRVVNYWSSSLLLELGCLHNGISHLHESLWRIDPQTPLQIVTKICTGDYIQDVYPLSNFIQVALNVGVYWYCYSTAAICGLEQWLGVRVRMSESLISKSGLKLLLGLLLEYGSKYLDYFFATWVLETHLPFREWSVDLNFVFSALTLLVGQQEGSWPAKNWVSGCWHLSGDCRGYLSGADLYTDITNKADATATHSLASVKSRLAFRFWYRPTRVVLDKGPLNG